MYTKIDGIRKYYIVIICICSSIICSNNYLQGQSNFVSNDLIIGKIIVSKSNTAGKYRMITFDISWENSWRTSKSANNWDAAWVFIKYKTAGGEWKHATLSNVPADHISPPGSTLDSPKDGKGIFIYRGEDGSGPFKASGVSLRWKYGLDNVSDAEAVNIRVFGIEMVYIPQGSFYAGDNGSVDAELTKGSNDNSPWFITGEDAINVTDTPSGGYYYRSSRDVWNDKFNASEDITGTSFTIPADFPKGFGAIYCMKYEMDQQQYVDFLNTLTASQSLNRYDKANFNKYGYTIAENNGVFSTSHPHRACGFISPADGLAYADWCGMRPMTELEFEKICRGSGNKPVHGEFAWGTTFSKNAVSVTGTEKDREYITKSGANSYYSETSFAPQFPLNSGIFEGPGKSREKSGASYYGVMEMSTNLHELCVSIGNQYGRSFTYMNGNGQLTQDGFADEINWPLKDGRGTGYRGGNFAREKGHMSVSVRVEATTAIDYNHRHIPWGFRGVRTIK